MLSDAVPVVEATWVDGQQQEEARYFSFGPRGEHDFYDTVDNAAIASALARGDRAVRLPPKPFGTFEIRFGASATSSKWTKPPKSGMLQVNLANHNSREVRKWDPDLAAAAPTTNAVHTANPVSRLGTPLVGRPLAPHVDRHSDAGRRATTHVTPEMRMREAEEQAVLTYAKCWLLLLVGGAALQLVGCLSIFSWHYRRKLWWCAPLGGAMVLVCALCFDSVVVAHSETWTHQPRGGSQPSWRRMFWQGVSVYACLSLIIWLGQTGRLCRKVCGFFFFLASFPASIVAPLLLLVILCGPVNKELAALGRAAQ